MLRAILAGLLALTLPGCWAAQTQLFGQADFVQPEGLEGKFISENVDGKSDGTVTLVRRPDGMIDGTALREAESEPRTSPVGFVAIPGGSGRYLLMVNRIPTEMAPKGKPPGELYLVARWQDDRLEAYWPQCAGTPDLADMKRETVDIVKEQVCTFTGKAGVLRAALLAERELETKRMFAPQMMGRLKRADADTSPEPESAPEAEPEG